MTQSDLFSQQEREQQISLHGYGELRYFPCWLEKQTADAYFQTLLSEITWEQPEILIYGKPMLIPRMQAWFGDPESHMNYSGTDFSPKPWHPVLTAIKKQIEQEFGYCFNSVLVNHYRNGDDSVSWHADDETELGKNPVIASLSLGVQRKFGLKPKSPKLPNAGLATVHLKLNHGDLVIMSGTTQRFWHHAVLKDKRVSESRINLTFRRIYQR